MAHNVEGGKEHKPQELDPEEHGGGREGTRERAKAITADGAPACAGSPGATL